MSELISIYFAGSIQKGHEQNDLEWSKPTIDELAKELKPYRLVSLNPADRSDDLEDTLSVLGRDMTQVFAADFVFADLRAKRGIGVGAEMMWAKYHKRPLLGWAPKNTHYHRDTTTLLGHRVENYIHPFVAGLCDKLVSSMKEAASFIKENLVDPKPIKGIEDITEYMAKYRNEQFCRDIPMQRIAKLSETMSNRILFNR